MKKNKIEKKEVKTMFVCRNCGFSNIEKEIVCSQCGSSEIVEISETLLILEGEQAMRFYTDGGFYRPDDLFKIEPYFFKTNNFIPGFSIECGDRLGRRFVLNKENSHYYCSPKDETSKYKIRECNKIQGIEFMENVTGNNALTGALLFGLTGAVVGYGQRREVISIKLHTTDIEEPIVNLEILSTPTDRNTEKYKYCYETANKIYGQFKAIVEKNNQVNNKKENSDYDFISKLIELSELKKQGFLSDEEFALAKEKLLK